MIYLDYSATTPVNPLVVETFARVSLEHFGNPNSAYRLGFEASGLIEQASQTIAQWLGVLPDEIIYTSGASEANNLAIKGVALAYGDRGRHMITTELEHSSIYGPLNFLSDCEYEVDFVKLDANGYVDLEHLRSLMRDDTILVSIGMVNSEVGLVQPIQAIGELVKQYPNCKLHVDITQAVGKIPVDLSVIDLASFSAHKFYGLKGVGALIRKSDVLLEPLIHGGKSTTIYRSGTPATGLIVSMAHALELSLRQLSEHLTQVRTLNIYLREVLQSNPLIAINSCVNCIPQILNISLQGCDPHHLQQWLNHREIFISVQSACSVGKVSKAVLALTHDQQRASESVRISLSYLTTKDELDQLVQALAEYGKEVIDEGH